MSAAIAASVAASRAIKSSKQHSSRQYVSAASRKAQMSAYHAKQAQNAYSVDNYWDNAAGASKLFRHFFASVRDAFAV